MKEIIKAILTLALILIVLTAGIYGLAAFIAWDINPANWDSFGRFITVLIISFAVVVCGVAYLNWRDKP